MATNFGSPYGQYVDRIAKENRADLWKQVVLPTAAFVTGGAALAGAGGASAAAPVSHAMAGGSPWAITPYASSVSMNAPGAISAGVSTASKFPWLAAGSKATDTLFGIYANRQQAGANRQALAYQQAKDAEAMAYERELEAERRREFNQQQDELKRQWDATQAFQQSQWNAQEEQRLYERRLAEAKEARQAPYREASLAALQQLPGLIASGAVSPGLGSLGSYRR